MKSSGTKMQNIHAEQGRANGGSGFNSQKCAKQLGESTYRDCIQWGFSEAEARRMQRIWESSFSAPLIQFF